MQHFKFNLLLSLVTFLLLTPAQTNAAYNTDDTVKNELLNAAQEKLDVEQKSLVSSKREELKSKKVAGKAKEQAMKEAEFQSKANQVLEKHNQKIVHSSSKLTPKKTNINGDKAVVNADELVTLTVSSRGEKPVISKMLKRHEFIYEKQNGEWILTEDKSLDTFGQAAKVEGDAEKIKEAPLNIDAQLVSKQFSPEQIIDSLFSFIAPPAIATSGTYNGNNAAAYARTYALGYNSAYRVYSSNGNENDCTNFISQAVNWGGWQHQGGFFTNINYWWYDPAQPWEAAWGNVGESWSWINVHYWYFYARQSGRVTAAGSLNDFKLGDTLQVDFDPDGTGGSAAPDGWLDHNAMITKKDSNGLYLSYHSNANLDIPLAYFAYLTPGSMYYGSIHKTQY